ncbi:MULTISPECIES: hypothetical protein [unclassified Sphingomonas]|uniref:hypothetical protein n=1 Tax=unclassified Sphingomonas TaxID=196159 RepID=UPI00226A76B2|nr:MULTISPECIES: hypothetical protein [unclassified Sphingomonas]
MLPSPRIFRSRWTALIWAGGIVWAAVDIAGSAPGKPAGNETAAVQNGQTGLTDPLGDPVDAADLKTIANLVDQ